MAQPSLPVRVEIDVEPVTGRDLFDFPRVERRAQAAALSLTLGEVPVRTGSSKVGIDVAIVGTLLPSEIEALCVDLLGMKAAAEAEQAVQDKADGDAAEAEAMGALYGVEVLRDMVSSAVTMGRDNDAAIYAAALDHRLVAEGRPVPEYEVRDVGSRALIDGPFSYLDALRAAEGFDSDEVVEVETP